MNRKELWVLICVLIGVALVAGVDLYIDAKEGGASLHLVIEGVVGVGALVCLFFATRASLNTARRLRAQNNEFSSYRAEAESWRAEAKKFVVGLARAIDEQLTKWKLSEAEKEVAFLLLKGLSLKEIADIRKTSERTARTQSLAIYAKSGLRGRSELAAFFLEDLLLPGSNRDY